MQNDDFSFDLASIAELTTPEEAPAAPEAAPADDRDGGLRVVALTEVMPNPWNPHRMTDEQLEDLENSLLEDGQWRPIIVVAMDGPDEHSPEDPPKAPYRIVDGEHLWRALSSLYMRGLAPNEAKVLVYGENSAVPIWKQQEIGQTINHGLRGTEEDPDKTQAVIANILQHRKPEVVAKRMGVGVEGVKHLAKGVPTSVRRAAAAAVARRTTTQLEGKLGSAVQTRHAERKHYTLALVFEDADGLQEFETLVADASELLGVDRADFKGRAGQHRIQVLRTALERLTPAEGGEDGDDAV